MLLLLRMWTFVKRSLKRLFRSESRMVDGLLDLSLVSSADQTVDEKLAQYCELTIRVLDCDRSSIFILDEAGEFFRASHNAGNPPDIAARFHQHKVSINDPLMLEAFRRGNRVVLNDALEDPRMNRRTASSARIRAMVVSPLVDLTGKPLAFMTAEFNESIGQFSASEGKILDGIAKVAELTLRNRLLEEANATLVERAVASERLESIRKLAAGVAHDLNNRLTVILGFFDVMNDFVPGREFKLAAEATQAAARMSRQLLQFGRGETLHASSCRVAEELNSIETELRKMVASRCSLVVHNDADVAIGVSSTQFFQILSNLVANAFDAIDERGVIVIHSQTSADGRWLFRIADSGSGIDANLAPRVFEPFVTTKAQGSGLGLSGVYGIVTAAGGQIEFHGNPAGGTTFEINLPLVKDQRCTMQVEPVPANNPCTQSARVVLVDDDEAIRNLVQHYLEAAGQTVCLSTTGGDPRLGELQDVDILISDIVMPDVDGFEVNRRVTEQCPDVKTLFISGYHPVLPAGEASPDWSFLAKPFTADEFQQKFQAVLGDIPSTAWLNADRA